MFRKSPVHVDPDPPSPVMSLLTSGRPSPTHQNSMHRTILVQYLLVAKLWKFKLSGNLNPLPLFVVYPLCSGSSIFILLRKSLVLTCLHLKLSILMKVRAATGISISIQSFVSVTNILAQKGDISNISGGLPIILSVFFTTAPKAYKNVESFSCKLVFYYKYWYFD